MEPSMTESDNDAFMFDQSSSILQQESLTPVNSIKTNEGTNDQVHFNTVLNRIEPASTQDEADIDVEILSDIEKQSKDLKQFEDEIKAGFDKGIEAAIQAGKAFFEINKRKLFAEFDNFKEYCKGRWGIGKSSAYRLISVYEIHRDVLSPIGDNILPTLTHASQYRALAILKDPDPQLKVLKHLATEYPNKSPTAKEITETIEYLKLKPPKIQKSIQKTNSAEGSGNNVSQEPSVSELSVEKEQLCMEAVSKLEKIMMLVSDFRKARENQPIAEGESAIARLFDILEVDLK